VKVYLGKFSHSGSKPASPLFRREDGAVVNLIGEKVRLSDWKQVEEPKL
jgi:hypothetical protein